VGGGVADETPRKHCDRGREGSGPSGTRANGLGKASPEVRTKHGCGGGPRGWGEARGGVGEERDLINA